MKAEGWKQHQEIMMTNPDAKGPGGRPSKYDTAFCEQIVEFMAQGYSVAAFAGHIDVARSTINEWAEQHPEFSEALSRGKGKRLLHWETDALRVAQKGGGPGTATIITFGLKNMGGEDWSAPDRHELSGPGGAPIQTEEISPRERIARKLAGLTAGSAEGRDTGGTD